MSINTVMDSFQHVFVTIKNLYDELNTTNKNEIWTKISIILHENNSLIAQIYKKVRKDPLIGKTKLKYNDKTEDLFNQTKTEKNSIIKLGLMTTVLHQILYHLMSIDEHCEMIMDGQSEMRILKKDIKYYVHLSNKIEKNIFFHAYILIISLESLFNSHLYVGIDFEYSGMDPVYKRKKIQLAQLNFEHDADLKSMIMIISPNELDPIIMKNFIRLIVCNGRIKKILHGSDALDILYLYEEMLENNPTKIKKFTRGLIDTRFLCEYYKLTKNDASNHKCYIYKALSYFGVVSPEKDAQLEKFLEEDLPPLHDLNWNIYQLTKQQILYAQYNVIFLKYFYYAIIHLATEDSVDPLVKKDIIELYKKVLFELIQLVYLDRKGVVDIGSKCKAEVDPINNYMIRHQGKILKLIDAHNEISKNLITANPKVEIDTIIKVNYFRGLVTNIIKKMVYTSAARNFTIYKDKSTVWSNGLDNAYLFEFFEENNYPYLGKMFKESEKILDQRLKMLFT